MFFQIKRVHLRLLHVSRLLLEGRDLTPARFDMMRIVDMHSAGVAQQKIEDLLGVSGATVSRMLKSLEQLGFIRRERMAEDRRRQLVMVTPAGRKRVSDAVFLLIETLVSHRLAWRLLGLEPRKAGPKLSALERTLCSMRKILGDPSPHYEPWINEPLSEAAFPVNTMVDGRIAYLSASAN